MGIQPTEMPESDITEQEPTLVRQEIAGRSPIQIAVARLKQDKIAMICLAVVILFALIAIFAPLLTKMFGVEVDAGSPSKDLDQFNFPLIGPPDHGFTWEAPLGLAPNSGDDNLAEWFYGARTSLIVATVSTLAATFIGVAIGLVAGFSRGWVDKVVNFLIDVFLSLPFLIVALAISPIIVTRFGNKPQQLENWQFVSLLLVLSLFGWMLLARLVRGEVLSLREREFIQAARVIGVPTRRILFKELLPNLIAPIIVSISLGLPAFVTAEAGLAFLGIGAVGKPSWGQTIDKAVPFFNTYPLYLYAPVLGVFLLVVALNLLGDAVRDAFDPKTRR
ncbi:ABC transporter permease [Nocardioides mesophilus]|uniref:ABC transporter permease n=1 Tax=Nocardioides mesophilus TaxID=433659 RepID=A0A7G9RA97_9ACTN|nr:ABC transporter permease [Nocardioides mesophilus]QNN52522.1 ABC transporter permease [Nocardioides mesophilus]